MYTIAFTKAALRVLRRLPRNIVDIMRAKLTEIAKDPYAPRNNVTQLVGRPGYRLRVGDWRLFYELQNEQLMLLVIKIGTRGEVYE
jgi:mRNA interferase RelE/StbE